MSDKRPAMTPDDLRARATAAGFHMAEHNVEADRLKAYGEDPIPYLQLAQAEALHLSILEVGASLIEALEAVADAAALQ